MIEKPHTHTHITIHSGCICCTLRADLLHELSVLAKAGTFDYCVIESTGIAEPMQVAETFAMGMQWDGKVCTCGVWVTLGIPIAVPICCQE